MKAAYQVFNRYHIDIFMHLIVCFFAKHLPINMIPIYFNMKTYLFEYDLILILHNIEIDMTSLAKDLTNC